VAGHAADGRFVHPDRLSDLAERQGTHMRYTVEEEALLLLDDLARDLDDRALTLVKRANEPVRTGELFGQPRLAAGGASFGEFGIIAPVDEQAGQGGAIDLDDPAFRSPADIKVGHDRLRPLPAEFEAGPRVIAAKLADHVGEILFVDSADALQLRK